MGKLQDDAPSSTRSTTPSHMGEASSAISLDTASSELPFQRYFDDEHDDDDLPPLYTDIEPQNGSHTVLVDPLAPRGVELGVTPFYTGPNETTTFYLDKRLDTDPIFLKQQIDAFAAFPPRPTMHIVGHHNETTKRHGKDDQSKVIDFDIQIDMTSLLYTNIRYQRNKSYISTVGNFEKVRRGTIRATRAPGFGGKGTPEASQPTLEEWCHRYCASHAGLKKFVLTRRVHGFDWDLIQFKLEHLVRSTNYQGHLDVRFEVKNQNIAIFNDCRTNRWRLTRWVELLFYFTFMWLFAWPWLYFRTKAYETVHVDWPMSWQECENGTSVKKYAAMSEEQWYNMWAQAIQRAVIARRQGYLHQNHLRAGFSEPEDSRREGLAGFLQSGIEAMGVVNHSFGWGGDC